MSRVPVRLRVTLAFAALMAVVLTALGLFVHSRLEAQLNESIRNGLRSRAGDVAALVRAEEAGLRGASRASLIESDESLAQVLTPAGQVVDSTPQLRGEPVLSRADLARATLEPTYFEREGLPGIEAAARLLAAPVETEEGDLVVVVGSSLGDRDEALASLAALLLIGGPAALLLSSLAAYWAVARALRPVDAMRREAAGISAGEPDRRLPVPGASDELRRLSETLNEMLSRLEAAIERERRFVDDAAHELRTPLAMHKAELEVALRYARSEEELLAAIASAIEENDRLIQLAEALLVVARSEGGKLAVKLDRVPVSELYESLGKRFGPRVAEGGRRLAIEETDGLAIEVDRLRAEQALTAMVDNAFRHGDGEIRLSARADGERVELHVKDQGPGFPPEFIERAFERFSRADVARTGGGSGLGLSIVATIAAAHGGRAEAANAAGGGADVWIEVPAAGSVDRSQA